MRFLAARTVPAPAERPNGRAAAEAVQEAAAQEGSHRALLCSRPDAGLHLAVDRALAEPFQRGEVRTTPCLARLGCLPAALEPLRFAGWPFQEEP